MKRNIYYSNKNYARKAMSILLKYKVMFETVEQSKEGGAAGEYELGVKFYSEGQGWVETYPLDQCELNEIELLAQ